MSNPQVQREKQRVKNHAKAREHLQDALRVLEEEYSNPNREKLTHIWLANRLHISSGIAYRLLIMCVPRSDYIVQFGHGPIFWTNDKLTVGEVMNILHTQCQQLMKDRK